MDGDVRLALARNGKADVFERGDEARSVVNVADLDALTTTASARVRDLAGKDRATLGAIKATMFAPAVEALGRGA